MKKLVVFIAILALTLNSEGEGFLARHNQGPNAVPITVNARVMRYLHLALNTPHKRQGMREMFERMRALRPMIDAKLDEAELPRELAAIPAVESMYRVDAESPSSAAGLWQLLPSTARSLGLKVTPANDERFDAEKETTAAVAYLKYIYEQCGRNWALALLSYNAGEGAVRRLVARTGIDDVFKLADDGHLKKTEHMNYVSKIMATMIVMDHPELVSD